MSPEKHGNSMTIVNMSTSTQVDCKINVWRGCVPASQAEVDQFNIVTEFLCLSGLTVCTTVINRPCDSDKCCRFVHLCIM